MMDFLIQFQPTIIILLLGAGGFVFRNWLTAKIIGSVQHGFNEKLEELRSQLRSKEIEISSLRDTVLTGRNQRQILVEKRRIEAVENIWKGVMELRKFRPVLNLMATINFERVAEMTPQNPKLRNWFKETNDSVPQMNGRITPNLTTYESEKPFIPLLTWAYFEAIHTIMADAAIRSRILALGISDAKKLLNPDYGKELLKTVLPKKSSYIDTHGAKIYHNLIEELEEKLLNELKNILDGKENDEQNVRQAEEIMKATRKAMAETEAVTDSANTPKTEQQTTA